MNAKDEDTEDMIMFARQTQTISQISVPEGVTSAARIELYNREPYNLGQSSYHLTVESGAAWLSYQARDIILYPGDQLVISAGSEPAIIASLREGGLIFLLSALQS